MKKLSQKQFDARYEELEDQARKLAKEVGRDTGHSAFFSTLPMPCGYERSPKGHTYGTRPKNFNLYAKPGIHFTWHFMKTPCNKLYRSCERPSVICLAKTNEGHFETTHLVGECPWKE